VTTALAELARVLRPGGVLAGADGLDTPARRERHVDDVFVPVDPGTLEGRLRAAGFGWARVDVAGDRVRFAAERLVGPGLHRGAVEELVVAGDPAAGGDRLGPALGQRVDQPGRARDA
jgi:hypothetical protein